MKTALRLLALAVIFVSAAYWLAAGGNRGWTKTSVPVRTLDDVTGIVGISYRKKFVPGVDFLAVAAAAGLVCAGASFLFRTKRAPRTSNEQTSNPLK